MPKKTFSDTQIRLLKEQAIRDYIKKQEFKQNHKGINTFIRRLRSIIHLNIAVGIIASIVLIYWKGLDLFFQLMLTGIIWITLITTIVGAVVRNK
jgi:hypothetical protein